MLFFLRVWAAVRILVIQSTVGVLVMRFQLFFALVAGLTLDLSRANPQMGPSGLARALKEGVTFADYLESKEFETVVRRTSELAKERKRELQSPFPHPVHPVPPLPHPGSNSTNSTGSGSDSDDGSDDGASAYTTSPYGSNANGTYSNSTTNGTDTSQPSHDSSDPNSMYMASAAILLSLMVVVPLFAVCVFPDIFFPKSDSQFGATGEPEDKGASTIPMVVSDSAGKEEKAFSGPSDEHADENGAEKDGTDLEKGTGPAGSDDPQNHPPATSFWQGLFGTAIWSKVSTEDEKFGSNHSQSTANEDTPATPIGTTAETTPEQDEEDRLRAGSLDSAIRQYTKASEADSTLTTAEDQEETRMIDNVSKDKELHLVDESGHSLIEDFSGNGKKGGDAHKDYVAVGTTDDAISI